MRRLLVIGVVAGDPDFVTVQAISAPTAVDVSFVLDKSPHVADLTAARQANCDRYIRDPGTARSWSTTRPGSGQWPTTRRPYGTGGTTGPAGWSRSPPLNSTTPAAAGSWCGETRVGSVQAVAAWHRIERTRGKLRERNGWIMDAYLLRRNPREP
jgi:hypothetical protein